MCTNPFWEWFISHCYSKYHSAVTNDCRGVHTAIIFLLMKEMLITFHIQYTCYMWFIISIYDHHKHFQAILMSCTCSFPDWPHNTDSAIWVPYPCPSVTSTLSINNICMLKIKVERWKEVNLGVKIKTWLKIKGRKGHSLEVSWKSSISLTKVCTEYLKGHRTGWFYS